MVRNNDDCSNLNTIDIGRFFFSIIVVMIHTHPFIAVSTEDTFVVQFINLVYETCCSVAVPFFLLASGYLLVVKNGSWMDLSLMALRKRLKKWLVLYAIWMLAYMPLTIYGIKLREFSLTLSILFLIRGVLVVGETFYNWPLWTLMTMIYGTLALWILKFRKKSLISLAVWIAVVAVLGTCFGFLMDMVNASDAAGLSILNGWELTVGWQIVKQLFSVFSVLVPAPERLWTGFVCMGMGVLIAEVYGCGEDSRTDREQLLSAFGSFVCFVVFRFIAIQMKSESLQYFWGLLCSAALFILLIQIKLPDWNVFLWLRKASEVTYFMHMMIFTMIGIFVYGNPDAYGLVPFFATIVLAWLLTLITGFAGKIRKVHKF